jgi:hypothetical protein
MSTRQSARRGLVALVAVTAGVAAFVTPGVAQAAPADPPALTRGSNPDVVYLVKDTIRDGDLRIAAPRGNHEALWSTARGYLLEDGPVGGRIAYRLVHVDRDGEKQVFTRRARSVAVSPDKRWVAWTVQLGREDSPPSVVTVAAADTGRVVAQRRFRAGAMVTAVTEHRVLVSRLFTAIRGTAWWNLDRDSLRRISDQSAVSVDLRQDRIVLDIPRDAPACNRVALLSDTEQTLWRSCQIRPHAWTRDGEHVLATHTYFDEAGTDRWLVLEGTTRERVGRVTGRLDWDAAWEDNGHFLTLAGSASGAAAVIRCTLGGRCERASRIWHLEMADYEYYASPPVVLPSN